MKKMELKRAIRAIKQHSKLSYGNLFISSDAISAGYTINNIKIHIDTNISNTFLVEMKVLENSIKCIKEDIIYMTEVDNELYINKLFLSNTLSNTNFKNNESNVNKYNIINHDLTNIFNVISENIAINHSHEGINYAFLDMKHESLVSTDTKMITISKLNINKIEANIIEKDVYINKLTIDTIKNIKNIKKIMLIIGKNNIEFIIDNITIISTAACNDKYPDYLRIVPKAIRAIIEIDFIIPFKGITSFDIQKDKIILKDITNNTDIEYNKTNYFDVEISLNVKQIANFIKQYKDAIIHMSIQEWNLPVLLNNGYNYNTIRIIMPIVNDNNRNISYLNIK